LQGAEALRESAILNSIKRAQPLGTFYILLGRYFKIFAEGGVQKCAVD
jgi:hypothetical protein